MGIMEQLQDMSKVFVKVDKEQGHILDPNMLSYNSLKLFGNNEIGMIANAQASLNQSNLLDMSTLFSVSDVVDAVNYKSGDVSPIFNGLMERHCQAFLQGEVVSDTAAFWRVYPQLTKYWDRKYLKEYGPLQSMMSLQPISWIENAAGELKRCNLELRERLLMRQLRANGPWTSLIVELGKADYLAAMSFVDWRTNMWADFIEQRNHDELMNGMGPEQQAKWQLKSRELQVEIEQQFVLDWWDWYNGVASLNGNFVTAYHQVEAIRASRWTEPWRPLDMRPVLAMLSTDLIPEQSLPTLPTYMDNGMPGLRHMEVKQWLAGQAVPETMLIRFPTGHSRATHMLHIAALPFNEDPMSNAQLLYAGALEERVWQITGYVGGDSNVAVMIPGDMP